LTIVRRCLDGLFFETRLNLEKYRFTRSFSLPGELDIIREEISIELRRQFTQTVYLDSLPTTC
jgi:hypothetical protein